MTSLTAAQLIEAFVRGILSPVVTPAHLIGLIGLALLMPQQARRTRIVTMACFAIAIGAGLSAIAYGVGATPARNVVLGAAAMSGVLAALATNLSRALIWPLAGIIGLAAGLDSPPETVSLTLGHVMLIGTGLGACAALAILTAAATALHRAWPIVPRVLGSWIAASAMLGLALRLVR